MIAYLKCTSRHDEGINIIREASSHCAVVVVGSNDIAITIYYVNTEKIEFMVTAGVCHGGSQFACCFEGDNLLHLAVGGSGSLQSSHFSRHIAGVGRPTACSRGPSKLLRRAANGQGLVGRSTDISNQFNYRCGSGRLESNGLHLNCFLLGGLLALLQVAHNFHIGHATAVVDVARAGDGFRHVVHEEAHHVVGGCGDVERIDVVGVRIACGACVVVAGHHFAREGIAQVNALDVQLVRTRGKGQGDGLRACRVEVQVAALHGQILQSDARHARGDFRGSP